MSRGILYEDLLQAGGSYLTERPRNPNPFHPDNQQTDPDDYYVPIPERDRTKVSGTVIESHIERDMREFLDKYGHKWRTMADIVRSAIYHFHATIIATHGTWEAFNRVKAEVRLRKLELDMEWEAKDEEVVKRAARLWAKIKPKRFDLRQQIVHDLRMYARGIFDEERVEKLWQMVREAGMEEAANIPPPEPPEEEIIAAIEPDPALESLGDEDE